MTRFGIVSANHKRRLIAMSSSSESDDANPGVDGKCNEGTSNSENSAKHAVSEEEPEEGSEEVEEESEKPSEKESEEESEEESKHEVEDKLEDELMEESDGDTDQDIANLKGETGTTIQREEGSKNSRSTVKGTFDLDLLDCSICLEIMTPPIHQCEQGHVLCKQCRAVLSENCPTCKSPLGDIRNLALEKLVESLWLDCKHEPDGCPVKIKLSDQALRSTHARVCIYKPHKCPISGCLFRVSKASVVGHVQNTHSKPHVVAKTVTPEKVEFEVPCVPGVTLLTAPEILRGRQVLKVFWLEIRQEYQEYVGATLRVFEKQVKKSKSLTMSVTGSDGASHILKGVIKRFSCGQKAKPIRLIFPASLVCNKSHPDYGKLVLAVEVCY